MDNWIIPLEKKNIKLINGKLYLSSYLLDELNWKINSLINVKVFAYLILLEKVEKVYCSICNQELINTNKDSICPHCREILINNELLNLSSTSITEIYRTRITQNKSISKHFLNAINYKYTLNIPQYISDILDLSKKEHFNFYYINTTIIIGG